MGRNGLPVSLARTLAMQAEDEETARLQTALRGRRLPAGFTHRPQSYAVDSVPARSLKPLAHADALGQGRSRVPSPNMWP
jgi:hypothetical protein